MYKTVRHGENSLQYTILPQNEEVLNHSGIQGKGRDLTPIVIRSQPQKHSSYICFSLFVVTVIVTGAVLIPFLITTDFLPIPGFINQKTPQKHAYLVSEQKLKLYATKNLTAILVEGKKHAAIKAFKTTVKPKITTKVTTPIITTTAEIENNTYFSENVTDFNETATATEVPAPEIKIVASKVKFTKPPMLSHVAKSTLQPVLKDKLNDEISAATPTMKIRESNNDLMINHGKSSTNDDSVDETSSIGNVVISDNVLKSTARMPDLDDKPTKASIILSKITPKNFVFTTKSPEVKSNDVNDKFSRKIEDQNDEADDDEEDDEVKIISNKSWLQAKWPFVDTSTYFQWAGYNSQDSLLLPILLGGTIVAVLLLLGICLSVRRRKRKAQRLETIGQITSDLQADKATLLTENPSEEE